MNFLTMRLLAIMRQKRYIIYDEPFRLNIIAERSNTVRSEHFDDKLSILFKDDANNWQSISYKVTTDPGAYYIDNPQKANPKGYGFIKKGQWLNAYTLGYHKGRTALQQVEPITVIRGYHLKGMFNRVAGTEDHGLYGNNIHDRIGNELRASAGCIVFRDQGDFDAFISMCRKHTALHGRFTLTMLDFRDARNVYVKKAVTTFGTLGLLTAGYFFNKAKNA